MALDIKDDMGGIVFFNDSDNEKAPQLSGEILVEGTQYRIAMWENEGKKGTFYGVKISPLEEDERESSSPRRNGGGGRGGYSKPASGGAARRGKPTRR